MAALVRAVRAQGRSLVYLKSKRCPQRLSAACISTSKKNKDIFPTADTQAVSKSEYQKKLEEHFADADPNAEKNWLYTGYDQTDREADTNIYHGMMFTLISVVFCLGGFIIVYLPGNILKTWARREAHLELERREKAGLPVIDVNFIPVEKINLPADEELKDTPIII